MSDGEADETRENRRARRPSPWQAIMSVVPNSALRRLLLAEGAVNTASGITVVALTVLAFDVGGASLLGLALSLRFLGVGLVRPAVGVLIDRLSPLSGVRMGASIAVFGAAVCVAGAALGELGGVVTVIIGICVLKLGDSIAKAGRRAVIPVAADSPSQAVATVGLVSMSAAVSALAGPAIASGVLVVADDAGAMIVGGVLYVFASFQMWRLPLSGEPPVPGGSMGRVVSGQRETLKAPIVVLSFTLLGASSFANGAISVFYAPIAIETLGIGDSGIGLLRSGFGVGALAMALMLLSAAASSRPALRLALAVALWGVMVACIGQVDVVSLALLAMLGMGAGLTLTETSYLTTLQRHLPDSLHPRVLSLGETVVFTAGGVGSLVVAPAIALFGLRGALTVVGLATATVALLAGLQIRRLHVDLPAPEKALDLLRGTPSFALLPPIELDLMAVRMRTRSLAASETLVSQGDEGRSWFILAEGELGVWVNGEQVNTMHPGESFGEIALLHARPRTATVRATSTAEVQEVSSAVFLRVIGGADARSFEEMIAERHDRLDWRTTETDAEDDDA